MTVVQKLKLTYCLYLAKTAVEIATCNHQIIVASEIKILDWPLKLEVPYKMTVCYRFELTYK